MGVADGERAAEEGQPHTEAATNTSGASGEAQLKTVLAAAAALVAALCHSLCALRTLALTEARALRAGIPLFFIGAITLVAFSVSLWVCLVALFGWMLMLATHSLGIALALLVVGHAALVVAVWHAMKYSLRQALFPRARAELRLLARTLRHDINRFADTGSTTGSKNDANPEYETPVQGEL
ncbi:MAG: hypothetical protein ACREPU_04390 [Rhodanobacteraceae bacterium]